MADHTKIKYAHEISPVMADGWDTIPTGGGFHCMWE